MADQNITPVSATVVGAAYTWTAANAADSYLYVNNGDVLLLVENRGASPLTVTIKRYATFDGEAVSDRTVSIAAGTFKVIGPFPSSYYSIKAAGTDVGKGKFSFSQDSSVVFKLFKVGA